MKIKYYYWIFIIFFYSHCARAWQHEIAIGFGQGKEVGQDYNNHGFVLSGKFYRFPNIDNTLIASLDGTLADIYSATPQHNHLVTLAGALAMRAYFANPLFHIVKPYMQVSFGPTYLSAKQLGNCQQGKHFAFQSTIETGLEIGDRCRSVDINLRLMHYCNAELFPPNHGIDLLPVLSIGYQF